MKERPQIEQRNWTDERNDHADVTPFPAEVCERERKRWSNGLHGAFENW
jgi:hypothetical protein